MYVYKTTEEFTGVMTPREAWMTAIPRRPGAPSRERDMYERFSDEARLTIEGAREQARQLGSGAVGSEHLLLSLLIEGNGTAIRTIEMLATHQRRFVGQR
jgi:ATP-dependent Clp protease ATP-binding subunit ClpA